MNNKTSKQLEIECLRKERQLYKRYIEILRSHLKEKLTDDENAEIKGLRNSWEALKKQKKIKKEEENKQYEEEIQKKIEAYEANKTRVKEIEAQIASLEAETAAKRSTNRNERCKCCGNVKDHEIINCPMNCCGTEDGECLR